ALTLCDRFENHSFGFGVGFERIFVGKKDGDGRSFRKFSVGELDVTVYHSTRGNSHFAIVSNAQAGTDADARLSERTDLTRRTSSDRTLLDRKSLTADRAAVFETRYSDGPTDLRFSRAPPQRVRPRDAQRRAETRRRRRRARGRPCVGCDRELGGPPTLLSFIPRCSSTSTARLCRYSIEYCSSA